jgi:hypothetical protein
MCVWVLKLIYEIHKSCRRTKFIYTFMAISYSVASSSKCWWRISQSRIALYSWSGVILGAKFHALEVESSCGWGFNASSLWSHDSIAETEKQEQYVAETFIVVMANLSH